MNALRERRDQNVSPVVRLPIFAGIFAVEAKDFVEFLEVQSFGKISKLARTTNSFQMNSARE